MLQKELQFLISKSNWISHQKETNPTAANDVLYFIQEFLFNLYSDDLPNDTGQTILKQQFTNGYCWHFANILQTTFNRGTINIIMPEANHIIWTDIDDISYDITGVVKIDSILVPTNFLQKCYPQFLNNFKHNTKLKNCQMTPKLIQQIIHHYQKEKGLQ